MAEAQEPRPDPGDPQAAIERYRDLAKYLITIFAGVGALLVAGSQLSSLGELSWDDERDHLLAAVIGLVVAIVAIAAVVVAAIKVLRPVEMSLDEILRDQKLEAEINGRPSLLGGAGTVRALKDFVQADFASDDDEAESEWKEVVEDVVGFAAYERAEGRFDRAWKVMLGAAFVGTLGIIAFAWGSNPPEEETADPVVRPAPVVLTFTLTDEGRETFGEAVGKECAEKPIRGLSVGGSEGAPRVVTLPEAGCKPAQFVLDPEYGAAVSTVESPSK